MKAIIRWILALPAAAVGFFLGALLAEFINISAVGFEANEAFWAVTDMNGLWIQGTYMLFATKAGSFGAAAYAFYKTVPNHKRLSLRILNIMISIVFLLVIIYGVVLLGWRHGFSFWYRCIMELASVLFGLWIVYFKAEDLDDLPFMN